MNLFLMSLGSKDALFGPSSAHYWSIHYWQFTEHRNCFFRQIPILKLRVNTCAEENELLRPPKCWFASVSVCGCQFREATAWQLAIGRASLALSRETISFQMLYFLYSLIAGLYMSGWEQVCMNGRVVGLIVLAGVDLSPPDGAAMQMSTCPLCSLLAPAREGVHNFC